MPVSSFSSRRAESFHFALELGHDLLAFAAQIEECVDVGKGGGHLFSLRDGLFQAFALLHYFLALFGLIPEIRVVDFLLRNFFSSSRLRGASKIAPHSFTLLSERNVLSF